MPYKYFLSVHGLSLLQSCIQFCNLMDCSAPISSVLHYLLEFVQIHIHWVGDTILPSHPLPSPLPSALSLSQHQGFSTELALHIRSPKYWSFRFRISPSNEYSRLISFSWLFWSPCSPRDSQESATPQFKSTHF